MKKIDVKWGMWTDAGAMQALLDGKVIVEQDSHPVVYREHPAQYRMNKRTGQIFNALGDPGCPRFGTAGVRWTTRSRFKEGK